MTGVVRVHETGGPEVLRFEDVEVGAPGPGQALIRQTAVGLNFIDVYFRTGLYPAPSLPFTPARRAPAWSRRSAPGSARSQVGQRVAYAGAARRLCRARG